jgi:hypothetical protein
VSSTSNTASKSSWGKYSWWNTQEDVLEDMTAALAQAKAGDEPTSSYTKQD